jgi:hypothetical protein
MDHLQYPSNGLPPLEIPFLCEEEYDGFGLQDYPERKGYKKDEITSGNWPQDRLGEAASFLQSWLYFGLMTVVFGIPVPLNDFTRLNSDGRKVITTKLLPKYLMEWHTRFSKLPQDDKRDYLNAIDKYIEMPTNFTIGRDIAPPSSNIPTVSLSIDILREALLAARLSLSRQIGDDVSSQEQWAEPMEYDSNAFLEKRMLDRGWCLNEIGRIRAKELSAATVYYLSSIPRYFRGLDHGSCTETECKFSSIDHSSYQVAHTLPGCSCELLSPAFDKIQSIISGCGIPLISSRIGPQGVEIDTLELKEGMEYVAISHVCSDGLANVSANALPACQIHRIHDLVKKMCITPIGKPRLSVDTRTGKDRLRKQVRRFLNRIPVLFWIDTLCVPVGKAHQALRDQAILQMRDVYSKSYKTLVLDAELVRFSGQRSVEESFARVFSSLWMRRCWTGNEVVLSKRTYVQFADTLFDLDAALLPEEFEIRPKKLHWPNGLETRFKFDTTFFHFSLSFHTIFLARVYLKDDKYSKNEDDMVRFFCHAWNCLPWRSTSEPRDKFLIFAFLLRLDVTDILKTDSAQERMRIILSAQRCLPAMLISIDCPRMQQPGLRWAPADFPVK